jgi:hypothetical protein
VRKVWCARHHSDRPPVIPAKEGMQIALSLRCDADACPRQLQLLRVPWRRVDVDLLGGVRQCMHQVDVASRGDGGRIERRRCVLTDSEEPRGGENTLWGP